MPRYRYAAKDLKGNRAIGVQDARDRTHAIELLRKRKLVIISLDEETPPLRFELPSLLGKRVKIDDTVLFSRQLATMIASGIPLVSALDVLGNQIEKGYFKKVILNVRDGVESGSSLSEAISRHKEVFSSLFVNMVRAGESSGMLDAIMDRVATYMEKTSALQKKVKSALMYPTVVSIMALGITLFLILKVIPIFKDIYAGLGSELPTATLILMSTSDFLQKNILAMIGAIIVIIFLIKKYINTPNGRLRYDTFLLKMPVFGTIIKKIAISRFTRTLSTLIKSGVPILTSLEIVAKTSGNRAVEIAIDGARTRVREGENIADPLAASKIFPPMVVQMVSVGERSGELEKMMSKVSDFYEQQVDAAVSGLTSLIEPLVIAFLGIVIGTIVVCMFLPIFKITTLIRA